MIYLPDIIFVWLCFGFAASCYFWYRNEKVCDYRISLIGNGTDDYEKLPSYEYMLVKRFWVWPLSKFLENNHD